MIPNMILQPIVENAIWHGIAPAKRPGLIQIRMFWGDPGELHIHILDNGRGLGDLPSTGSNSEQMHTSKGIQLIRKRIQFYHPENRLELHSRKDPSGTKAEFFLVIPQGVQLLPK